jgi:hypothetical protein
MHSLRPLATVPDVHVRCLTLRKKLRKAGTVNSALEAFLAPAYLGAILRLALRCVRNFAKPAL